MGMMDSIYQKRYEFVKDKRREPEYLIMSSDVLTELKREMNVWFTGMSQVDEKPSTFHGLIICSLEWTRAKNYLEVA